MKNLFGSLWLALVLFGCKNAGTGTPTATVNSFIAASREGNLPEIKKYISRQDVGFMEMGQGFLSRLDSNAAKEMTAQFSSEFKEKLTDKKISVKEEKIDGTNATVNVEFSQGGKTETRPFTLVKEDGQWKISLVSTGMNNSGTEKADIEEAMKSINLDSLQTSIQNEMGDFNKMEKDSLNKVMKEGLKELERFKNLHTDSTN